MNLLIDQGNSYCKIALCDQDKFVHFDKTNNLDSNYLDNIFSSYSPSKCIVSSVIELNQNILLKLKTLDSLHLLSQESKLPIDLVYGTKNTLGKDRIAAAVGANTLFPGENLLIIDFGTAITYDVLTKNIFSGGNIAPGINLRFKSLHTETDQLPLISLKKDFPAIGDSTKNAIISGVQTGIKFEIEGYINYMSKNFDDFKVIFTGGDAAFFEKIINSTIFVEPNLIFIGLNKILKDND